MSIIARKLGAIAVLVLVASAGLGTVAQAHHATADDVLECDQVVQATTTLSHDVGPCLNNGLIVGANNITINLNGKRVFGACPSGTDTSSSGAGILVEGRSGVTINGPGTIECFSGGVEIRAVRRGHDQVVTPTSVPATGNVGVSAVVPANNNTVQNATIQDNVSGGVSDWGEGVGLWGTSGNKVLNNVIRRNGPYAGVGLYDRADNNTVMGNTVADNNIAQSAGTNQDTGIRIEPQAEKNVVENNTVTNSGLEGISVLAGPTPFTNNNTIRNNTVSGNGFHTKAHRKGNGIALFGFTVASNTVTNTVSGNTVCGNAASGIMVNGGDKDGTTPSRKNSITGNTAGAGTCASNAVAGVAGTADLQDGNGHCLANTWSGNTYGTKNPACIA